MNERFGPRLRVALLTAILTATSFVVSAAPGTYDPSRPLRPTAPLPFAVSPQVALAGYCATPNPAFTGRLTASSSSTTAVSAITSPTVYGYLSNIETKWACTLYRRYSGLAWNTDTSSGTFAWGTLINSTSVNCNWAVGTDDYLKANDTADCPDFDAEYAMAITLAPEGVYQADNTHDSFGDFGFVHSDCDITPYYGAAPLHTEQSFTSSNVYNRPGQNCDPRTLDGTGTTQTVTYDATAPTGSIVIDAGAAATNSQTVTLTLSATDLVSGVHQMRFSNDGSNWSSWEAYGTSKSWSLTSGQGTKTVYARFRDNNLNVSATVSDSIIYDTTAPSATWTAPAAGSTTIVATYGFDLTWSESDNLSGVDSRTVQRQKATVSGGTSCLTDWTNDGSSAPLGPSPQPVGDLLLGTCYRWLLTVTDAAGNASSAFTSGSIIRDTAEGLGAKRQHTFETWDLGTGDALSVNVANGNLVVSHPIVALPIRGGAVDLSLSYNSHDTASVGLGPGWRLNVQRRLTVNGDGTVTFVDDRGSRFKFTNPQTVGSVTTYTRPTDLYATLVRNTGTSPQFTLTYRELAVDRFTTFGSDALLTTSLDRHGNGYTLAYETSSSRISTLTENGNNRVVNFAWDGSGRLSSITDWAWIDGNGIVQTSATGSRRVYRFFYDGSGRLAGWSNPLNTSGSCPTVGSNLTCLSYSSGLLSAVSKTQTVTTLSSGNLGTTTVTATTEITYAGSNAATVRDAHQTSVSGSSTAITAVAGPGVQVVRPGTPASTTQYVLVSATESLGRVRSVLRRLGSGGSAVDVEQRTTWHGTHHVEPEAVTDNYDAKLSTPARTVSYTYVAGSIGPVVSRMTEPLDGSNNRTTDYAYNANDDVTQVIVALNGSGTTRTITRYCYTSSGCSTTATGLLMLAQIDNYDDGTKGGTDGNTKDVTTEFTYDTYGQRTLEKRWNYDGSGNLLDSREIGYTFDANGNLTAQISNYSDGDTNDPYDADPDPATGARTDLTTAYAYDTAGNRVSSADPRRPLGSGLHADDYVTRFEFDALNRQTKATAPRDPADTSAPKSSSAVHDELGNVRFATDFGGVVTATEYDRAGRATRTFEDVDGAGGTSAATTSATTYDASGRMVTSKDRNQVADIGLGAAATTYDELGQATDVVDASGSSPNVSSTTHNVYDALGRQLSTTIGYGSAAAQTTTTGYDLGGRAIETDDEFACSTATYDYRHLALTQTSGLEGGTCASGADTRTVTHSYDGLGRLTRSAVTAGTDSGDWTFDATLDGAGRQLTTAVKKGGVTSTTTFTLSPLDQVRAEARPDGSTTKLNHDPAGNATDRCYWQPSVTVGDCYEEGTTPWSNPPTQVTTSSYDARNSRVDLRDSASGTATTYDPDHNYQIKAFYVPTGSGREHQTLYGYDSRHRLVTIDHQLCVLDTGTPTVPHDCTSTTATGSDDYGYDDNDNRTQVSESNGSANSDHYYCYDALNRLQYRKTGADCSGTTNEEYVFDASGNRTKAILGGVTTNFAYNNAGQLCKVGATTCGTPNVSYDDAGRTASYGGWAYEYDAEGRLVRACESTSCSGSIDKVEFTYDAEGRRTQAKEYTAGALTTTRDFRYQDGAIVEESTNGSVSRGYVLDDSGAVIRFCDTSCASPTTSYLVTWNGHGDALAVWRIKSDGSLEIANSFTYSTWGTPTIKSDHINSDTSLQYGDLGFRFLYVGRFGVQWDNFSDLGLHYMRARHYAPALGRFIQPDPSGAEDNHYAYAENDPLTTIDPCGTKGARLPSTCRGKLQELLKRVSEFIRRTQQLYRDPRKIPWYTKQPGYPGTVVGHQDVWKGVRTRIERLLNGLDRDNCFGPPGRVLTRYLRLVRYLPTPGPLSRPTPPSNQNWAATSNDGLIETIVAALGGAVAGLGAWQLGKLTGGMGGGIPRYAIR